jgi:hypothetical protein
MAAQLITETEWHESPGYGPTEYAIGYLKQMVPSPYYRDGRDVPDMGFFTSPVPGEDLVATATIDVAGPATEVEFTLTGVYGELTGINIVIDRTDGLNGPFAPGLLFNDEPITGVQAAASLAALISLEDDMSAVASAGTVTVTIVGTDVTALTISTLTVA